MHPRQQPPPRIALVVDKLDAGGAEHHAISLARELSLRGASVSLLRLKPHGALEPELALSPSIASFCVDARKKIDLQAARKLSEVLARLDCDVVLGVNPYATLYSVLAARLGELRRPVVSIFHSTDLPGLKNTLQMAFYRLVFPLTDSLVYVSHQQRDYWRARGLRSRHELVIQNGVDTQRFSSEHCVDEARGIRSSLGFTEANTVFGVCAALRPEKCHTDFVDAVAAARKRDPGIRGLIIGDGPMRHRIEERITQHRLNDAVRLVGFQRDVRPYVTACDAMALPSSSETFPLAVLESMAMGKPVVASRTGGTVEQIQDGTSGLLFTPRSVPELSAQLLKMTNVATRTRMAQAALLEARERFSLSRMVADYEALITTRAQAHRATPPA